MPRQQSGNCCIDITYDGGSKAARTFTWLLLSAVVSAVIGTAGWFDSTKVERVSPEIGKIAPESMPLERAATAFQRVEGPVWASGGYPLFATILNLQGTEQPR